MHWIFIKEHPFKGKWFPISLTWFFLGGHICGDDSPPLIAGFPGSMMGLADFGCTSSMSPSKSENFHDSYYSETASWNPKMVFSNINHSKDERLVHFTLRKPGLALAIAAGLMLLDHRSWWIGPIQNNPFSHLIKIIKKYFYIWYCMILQFYEISPKK